MAHMADTLSVYRILVGKAEGRGIMGRPRRRWENNIKTEFKNKTRFGQCSPGLTVVG